MSKEQKIWLVVKVIIKTLAIYALAFLLMFFIVTITCLAATYDDATEISEININIFTFSKSAGSKRTVANQITEPQEKTLLDYSEIKRIAEENEKKEAIMKKGKESLEKIAQEEINFEKRIKKIERKKLAKEKAKKEAEEKAEAERKAQELANRQRLSSLYTEENVELLAHLINGEAGDQGDECQQAVGQVVVNRVKSKGFQNTLKGVIFAHGQYSCTWDGNFNKTPSKAAYRNARAVLSGNTIIDVPESVVFQSQFRQGSGVWRKIGSETFCY